LINEYNRGVAAKQKEKDRKREAAAKELAKRRERAAKERERQQAERQKQRDALKLQKAREKELEEESSEEEAEKFWSVRFDDRASEILMHCYQDTCSDSDFNHDDDAVATADIWPLQDAHVATHATSSFTRDIKLSGLSARQAEAAIAAAALNSVDDQCAEMQPNKRAERRFAGARVSGRKSIEEVKRAKTGGLVPTLSSVQAQVDQARINLFAEPQENASESIYPRSAYPPTYVPLRVHKPKPSLSTRDQVLRILQRSGESRQMLAARFHRTGVCYSRRGLTAEQSALVAAQVTTFYNSWYLFDSDRTFVSMLLDCLFVLIVSLLFARWVCNRCASCQESSACFSTESHFCAGIGRDRLHRFQAASARSIRFGHSCAV
jgi:hypothetical protein